MCWRVIWPLIEKHFRFHSLRPLSWGFQVFFSSSSFRESSTLSSRLCVRSSCKTMSSRWKVCLSHFSSLAFSFLFHFTLLLCNFFFFSHRMNAWFTVACTLTQLKMLLAVFLCVCWITDRIAKQNEGATCVCITVTLSLFSFVTSLRFLSFFFFFSLHLPFDLSWAMCRINWRRKRISSWRERIVTLCKQVLQMLLFLERTGDVSLWCDYCYHGANGYFLRFNITGRERRKKGTQLTVKVNSQSLDMDSVHSLSFNMTPLPSIVIVNSLAHSCDECDSWNFFFLHFLSLIFLHIRFFIFFVSFDI